MNNLCNRQGESGPVPNRKERIFADQDEWFFATREGAPIGPYDNRYEAHRGLNDFIEFMQLAEPKTLSRLYSSLAG